MDKIFYNGIIRTMDKAIPMAEAVAIKNRIILRVGKNEDILKLKNENTMVIDLKGRLMVPGFNDSHMHLLGCGLTFDYVSLGKSTSIDDLIKIGQDALKDREYKCGDWVVGRGWNNDYWNKETFPTKYDLDKVSTELPVVFTRACGHVTVVNSKALEFMNVDKTTPQVEGGVFDKDESGEPLGIFRELALNLVYDRIPNPSVEDLKKMIVNAANRALEQGITSVQSDDFESAPGKDFQKVLRAYEELVEENALPVRVNEQCLLFTKERLEEFFSLGYKTNKGNDFFKIGPLKLLGDGSLGARTAYLSKPYADDPSTCGIPCYTQEELDELIITAHNNHMPCAVHCIGDGIMSMVLNSIEKAQMLNPKKDMRHGIVHCQITDKEILERYRDLNVIAHIQPIFLHYDSHIVDKRVGKELAKTSYNWKSMTDMGIHVACGSDAPVEPFDVLPNIYCAVTRKDLKGYPEEGWYPEQCMSVEEAVYGFTMGSAYASYDENIKGSITVGKYADMVVLEENIFEIDPMRIKDVKVDMTIVNGDIKFSR